MRAALRDAGRRLAELLSPTLRRARRKRELEAVLRSVGVSRAQARQAVARVYGGRKGSTDGQ
jgi:hypothetical protein